MGTINPPGIGFAAQGWQCPCCAAIYSPNTTQCFTCSGKHNQNWSKVTGNINADDVLAPKSTKELLLEKNIKKYDPRFIGDDE